MSSPAAVSSVLYGERLGLMLDYIDPEAQHFIDCITLMFKTTTPMLYIPPALLRRLGAKVWRDHVEAWDGIFSQGLPLLARHFHSAGCVCFIPFPVCLIASGPLHPEHLQAVTSGDWQSQEIPRSPGQPADAGQDVH